MCFSPALNKGEKKAGSMPCIKNTAQLKHLNALLIMD
jgi:hypothetical protein